jgi:hypothetical protein
MGNKQSILRLTKNVRLVAIIILSCGVDTVDSKQQEQHVNWRQSKGKNLTENLTQRLRDNVEIDSIDSFICAWGTHAHDILPCSCCYFMPTRGDYESVLSQDNGLRKKAYIKRGKPRNETSR